MRDIVVIAGRGKFGDTNWGADFSQTEEIRQQWYDNLKAHMNEVVILSGGGSFMGDYWLGVLEQIRMATCGDKPAVKIKLIHMTPKFSGLTEFEPFIDSWQISILAENQDNYRF